MSVKKHATPSKNRKTRAPAQYAPKPKPEVLPSAVIVDLALRRITARVLEELKAPSAVPSKIIQAALEEAKIQGAQEAFKAAMFAAL